MRDSQAAHAADLGEPGPNMPRRLGHLLEVVAVNLDGHIAAHAADEFVEPHLDGLRDVVRVADDDRGLLLDAVDDLILGAYFLRAIGSSASA